MEIAPADMSIDLQIGRFSFNGCIIDGQELFLYPFKPGLVRSEIKACMRIQQHAPGAVIKLNIAAPGLVQIADDLMISVDQILHQIVGIRIITTGIVDGKGHDHLLQKLGRSGDGLFSDGICVFELFYKLKMFHKGMPAGQRNLACQIGIVDHSRFIMEGKSRFGGRMTDAVEGPHKVQMPGTAAELSVRDHMIADLFDLTDQIRDAFIFDQSQIIAADLPGRLIQPGLL